MSPIPWFKVDDTLHGHPKPRRAGLPAMGLWALAGSYSSQYLTEGFVPEWFVLGWPQGRKRAAELVDVGLWAPDEQGGEQGWTFHDWEHYQPSKAEIEADRAANRERQKRFRQKRREAKREAQGNDVSNGVSNDPPTRPDPTRPTLEVLRSVGEGQDSSSSSPSVRRRGADG